jgi:tetratricopeptide (TPR) repeat protein
MNLSSTNPTKLNSQNPWPGLAAYDEASTKFFFGREEEANDLFRLVQLAPLTVIYGKSGLGKTSLLQAGLYPLLREKHYLPIHLRIDFSVSASHSPFEQVIQGLIAELDSVQADYPSPDDESLWEYLHRKDFEVWSQDNFLLTPVLVFDQFEEIFSRSGSNTALIQQVSDGLADLIENRIPSEIANTAPNPRRSRLDLLSQRYRIILSFREDFLPEIKTWERKVPSLLHNCLRLDPMSRQCAIEAVEQAGKTILCEGVAPCIVDFVGKLDQKGDSTDPSSMTIEPVLLSLFCYQLNRRRPPGSHVDEALVLNAGQDILNRFYREALDDPAVKGPPEVENFIEDYLIQGDHFRGNYPKEEALDNNLLTGDQLAALTDKHRLLRIVPYQDTTRVELIHDRLVPVVRKARDERKIKQHEDEQEHLIRKAQAEATRMKRIGIVIGVLFLVAVFFWYKTYEANQRAETAQHQAEGLLGFLLGEQFLGEIRDVGRSTMLQQVRDKVESYLNTSTQNPALIRGLALRNAGDLERTRGSLSKSVKFFEEALTVLKSSPNTLISAREVARTRGRIGEALVDQGYVSQALEHYTTAVKDWRQVTASVEVEVSDCTNLASNLVRTALLKYRMGQATLAHKDLDQAFNIITTIPFGHCGSIANTGGAYLDAKVLEVLSEALLLRGNILNVQEDYERAVRLANEAKKLRPASASPIQQKAVAFASLASRKLIENPQHALKNYREVLAEFDILRGRDPTNRLWEREQAAVQILIAEGIVSCYQSKQRNCIAMSLLEAEVTSLKALETLKILTELDPSNLSWQRDLGWGQQVRAKVLAAQTRSIERLEVLQESERSYSATVPDHSDADWVWLLGSTLLDQSWALADLKRWHEAKTTLQRVITLFEQFGKESEAQGDNLVAVNYLRHARTEQGKLLRKAGDKTGADLAEKEQKRLEEQDHNLYRKLTEHNEQKTAKLDTAHATSVNQGAKLFKEENYAAALREFNTAEATMQEYLSLQPTASEGYDSLRNVQDWIQQTQEKLGNSKEAHAALNVMADMASIATLLHPAPDYDSLALAKRKIAQLYYNSNRLDEALADVSQEIAVREIIVQKDQKNAQHLHDLSNTHFGQGLVRRAAGKPAWEEAIRIGIAYIEHTSNIDKKNPQHLSQLGAYRQYLAGEFDAEGLKEKALTEYRLALRAYQQAAKLSRSDDTARKGILELEELGIR